MKQNEAFSKPRFCRSMSVDKIRKAFERNEREIEARRGYKDSRIPPFDLNWDGSMYAAPWVQSRFNDYASGYYDAAWDCFVGGQMVPTAQDHSSPLGQEGGGR